MLKDEKLKDLLEAGYETSDADFVAHMKEKMCRTAYFMAQALSRRNQYTYLTSIDLQSEIDHQLQLAGVPSTAKYFNPVDWFSSEWTQAMKGNPTSTYFAHEYLELFDREGENPTNYRLKPALYGSVVTILSELRSSAHSVSAPQSHKLVLGEPEVHGATSETKPIIAAGDSDISHLADELDKEGVFDPNDATDARARTLRAVIVRRGQPQFREDLIAAYGRRCAVTGCDAVPALEAAHIVPYAGATTNVVSNGILLRSDIHTLFDLDLIGIDPNSGLIHISKKLRGTVYAALEGKPLSKPNHPFAAPDKAALSTRWNRFLSER